MIAVETACRTCGHELACAECIACATCGDECACADEVEPVE